MSDDGTRGVLVVDDEKHLCWVLDKILSGQGYSVRTADSVASALAALNTFDCRVAVVDYRLPDGDGLTLIDEMTARRPGLRAILMTSFGGEELVRATRGRVAAYIEKPFVNSALIREIERVRTEVDAGERSQGTGGAARSVPPASHR